MKFFSSIVILALACSLTTGFPFVNRNPSQWQNQLQNQWQNLVGQVQNWQNQFQSAVQQLFNNANANLQNPQLQQLINFLNNPQSLQSFLANRPDLRPLFEKADSLKAYLADPKNFANLLTDLQNTAAQNLQTTLQNLLNNNPNLQNILQSPQYQQLLNFLNNPQSLQALLNNNPRIQSLALSRENLVNFFANSQQNLQEFLNNLQANLQNAVQNLINSVNQQQIPAFESLKDLIERLKELKANPESILEDAQVKSELEELRNKRQALLDYLKGLKSRLAEFRARVGVPLVDLEKSVSALESFLNQLNGNLNQNLNQLNNQINNNVNQVNNQLAQLIQNGQSAVENFVNQVLAIPATVAQFLAQLSEQLNANRA